MYKVIWIEEGEWEYDVVPAPCDSSVPSRAFQCHSGGLERQAYQGLVRWHLIKD